MAQYVPLTWKQVWLEVQNRGREIGMRKKTV